MIPRGVISEKKKGKGMFRRWLVFLSVGEEKKKRGGGRGKKGACLRSVERHAGKGERGTCTCGSSD